MKKYVKRTVMILILVFAALTAIVFIYLQQPKFGKAPTGQRLERIKNSPNYKNGSFQNIENTPDLAEGVSMGKVFWRFLFEKVPKGVPSSEIPHIQTDLHLLDRATDVLVWFGHSSYFLQTDGIRLLVDPVFNGHASPFSFTTKSFPGTTSYHVEDMPEIDILIITHDHWDHLDYPTVKKLQPKVNRVVCPLGVGAHLEHWGYPSAKIIELDWYESTELGNGIILHAESARHFAGRTLKRNGTLWASFVLYTPSQRIYIGGDSGYGEHFAKIGKQHGPFDLAILENGQYNPYWIYIHMLPEQVLKAAVDLRTKRLLPVHHSKFALAMHSWDDPLNSITEAHKSETPALLTPMIGQPVYLTDSTNTFTNWWEGLD